MPLYWKEEPVQRPHLCWPLWFAVTAADHKTEAAPEASSWLEQEHSHVSGQGKTTATIKTYLIVIMTKANSNSVCHHVAFYHPTWYKIFFYAHLMFGFIMHRGTRHSSPCLWAMAILYSTPFPFPLLFNSYGDAAVPFYLELPSVSPCKGTLLPHIHLPFHQEAQGPSLQHCVPAGWPPASWLFLPRCRTSNFPLLSFTRVLSALTPGHATSSNWPLGLRAVDHNTWSLSPDLVSVCLTVTSLLDIHNSSAQFSAPPHPQSWWPWNS